jgi:ATPase subunit of ABC transporter with duplicated ATPase domains
VAAREVRTLLAKYGLKADHVHRPRRRCRPGERTRASLALLQAVGVNLLVLDEPTNHLDLPAIEQLEQALARTTGRCCWSPTTAGCSTPCRSTARCASTRAGLDP